MKTPGGGIPADDGTWHDFTVGAEPVAVASSGRPGNHGFGGRGHDARSRGWGPAVAIAATVVLVVPVLLAGPRRRRRVVAAGVMVFLLAPAAALAQTTTQVVEYYTTDAIGSLRAVTKQVNGQWQVVARHDFMPFGEEVAPQVPPQDKRLFTGKERDSETGQDYFEARYLNARRGRFTTVDPALTITKNFEDPQLWNRYVYVGNNPLRYVDPDGRAQIEIRYTRIGPGYTHAYLVVTDTNGDRTYFRAGPSAGGPSSGGSGALSSGCGGSASQSSGSGSSGSNSSNSSSPGSGPGGPGANTGPFGQLYANSGAYVPGTIDYEITPAASTTLLSNDQPAAAYVTQLQGYEKAVNEAGIPYNPVSTNSNAYATGAAKSLGLTVPEPSAWAPGRETKLPIEPLPPPPRKK